MYLSKIYIQITYNFRKFYNGTFYVTNIQSMISSKYLKNLIKPKSSKMS